jgi:2-methylcitrate dehydratase
MSWERVVDKFGWLAEPFCDEPLRDEIVAAVARLDEIEVTGLTGLLGSVPPTPRCARSRPRF